MVTANYPPEYSGAALQCMRLSRFLRQRQIDLFVMTLTNDDSLPRSQMFDDVEIDRYVDFLILPALTVM